MDSSHPSRLTLDRPFSCQQLYISRVQKKLEGCVGAKRHHWRKGENFLVRHSIDGSGEAGGRKGGIIEYNLIEPRVSTPLNRA